MGLRIVSEILRVLDLAYAIIVWGIEEFPNIEELSNIPPETIVHLYGSIPRKIKAVLFWRHELTLLLISSLILIYCNGFYFFKTCIYTYS